MAPCPWSDHAPATIAFCEARLCAWVAEPSNAWSNLGFVIVGLVVLAQSRGAALLRLIGVVGVLLGIGSFALHATATRWGELVDVGSMYLISALGAWFAAHRIWPMSMGQLVVGYAATVAGSVGLMVLFHTNGILLFAAQIAFATMAETWLWLRGRRYRSYRYLQLVVATFALAFLSWSLDKWNILCDPNNHLVTGHAVWHVLCALAVYFFSRQQALEARAKHHPRLPDDR